jgi:hypothetical protein
VEVVDLLWVLQLEQEVLAVVALPQITLLLVHPAQLILEVAVEVLVIIILQPQEMVVLV